MLLSSRKPRCLVLLPAHYFVTMMPCAQKYAFLITPRTESSLLSTLATISRQNAFPHQPKLTASILPSFPTTTSQKCQLPPQPHHRPHHSPNDKNPIQSPPHQLSPQCPVTKVETSPALLIKKLSDKAKLPTRGSAFAAGYDIYAAKDTVVPARGKVLVDTDISMAVPAGTCMFASPTPQTLTPRSHSDLVNSEHMILIHENRWTYSPPLRPSIQTHDRHGCRCNRRRLQGPS